MVRRPPYSIILASFEPSGGKGASENANSLSPRSTRVGTFLRRPMRILSSGEMLNDSSSADRIQSVSNSYAYENSYMSFQSAWDSAGGDPWRLLVGGGWTNTCL